MGISEFWPRVQKKSFFDPPECFLEKICLDQGTQRCPARCFPPPHSPLESALCGKHLPWGVNDPAPHSPRADMHCSGSELVQKFKKNQCSRIEICILQEPSRCRYCRTERTKTGNRKCYISIMQENRTQEHKFVLRILITIQKLRIPFQFQEQRPPEGFVRCAWF